MKKNTRDKWKRKVVLFIKWHDACHPSSGWKDVNDYRGGGEKGTMLAEVCTVGRLVAEDAHAVRVAATWGECNDVQGVITIPKSNIVERKVLLKGVRDGH